MLGSTERESWLAAARIRPLPAALLAVALAAPLVIRFGWRADLPAFLGLAAAGAVLSRVDLGLRRLPDALTLSAAVATFTLLGLAALQLGSGRLLHALLGMLALSGFYAVLWFIAPRQVGLGDVKLALSIGLALGWLGLRAFVLGLILIHAIGLACAIMVLASGRAGRRDELPFGPIMLGGTFVAVLICA
jgi:leader peptidase (prepilin peptidase) / N-methyltransferase